MTRSTIDFGIDLGTTNSEVAMLKGTTVQVFRNVEGAEYTPSVVWFDKSKRVIVGRPAKERIEVDPENAFAEFKLQMGTGEAYRPPNLGRELKPEDLSAEVLKSLRGDARRATNEDPTAAVITIPAAFEEPQCAATRRAAQAAGLVTSPLLQEPIAAALAYGFQAEEDRAYWLVYDFGGGTFDAAVIQLRDGSLQVVNHGGDNHLGGKLIDWEIVQQLFVPALTRSNALADFRRGVPKWRGAFAKLKGKAEATKIRLSQDVTAEAVEDFVCVDDRGQPVRLELEVSRAELEKLMEGFVERSINISRRVLSEQRLSPKDMQRLILVGGPTMTPYFRQRLEDPREGLGIPLAADVDPLTIVARGAAVFAGTQRLEAPATAAAPAAGASHDVTVELEYKPVGTDAEPLVGGRVRAPAGVDLAGHSIEFVNAERRPPWRSGKIGLAPDGSFVTTLWAEKGKANTFTIEVTDAQGRPRRANPDRLTYTIGATIAEPPLPHTIGIALANGDMRVVVPKGAPLPARGRAEVQTVAEVRPGSHGDVVKIPVVAGEHHRAERNVMIGELKIASDRIKRPLPAGSTVEVTVEIDASRQVTTHAYIPHLDDEMEGVHRLSMNNADAKELAATLASERKRLEEARARATSTGEQRAQRELAVIDRERMVHDVDAALAAAEGDRDARDKAQKRLQELQARIDDVEASLAWPDLVARAEKEIGVERQIAADASLGATAQEKARIADLEVEIRRAMEAHDSEVVEAKVKELDALGYKVMARQPGWWVGLFQQIEGKAGSMTDRTQAEAYLQQGRRAMAANDVDALRAACLQLFGLLPKEQAEQIKGFGSGVR